MSENNDEGLPHDVLPADSFDQFFELNKERLQQMMSEHNDYEMLYAVWFAGYDYGLRTMSGFSRSLFTDISGESNETQS